MPPLISIITPCYNAEKYISLTIESVLAQTYQNWEMLIIDDCSTDNSFEILQSFSRTDRRIKVAKLEQNAGAGKARNKAIELSQGEYLAFLDSDDLWFPQKLEQQIQFMQKNEVDFCFTRYEHIDKNGNSLGKIAKITRKLTYKKMLFHDFVGCLTVVYKQNLNNKIYFPPIKIGLEDYEYFLSVLQRKKNAMGFNQILAKYRILHGSLSRDKIKLLFSYFDIMRKYEKQNMLLAIFYLLTNQLIKFLWKYERVFRLFKIDTLSR